MSNRTALFLIVAIIAGCSSDEKTSEVQKLESSELHVLGSFCKDDYYIINGNEFSFIEDGKKHLIFDNVKLTDIGGNRIEMISNYNSFKVRTTLLLESDANIISFENVAFDLPEDMPDRAAKSDLLAKKAAGIRSAPKMTLCPASSSQGKLRG